MSKPYGKRRGRSYARKTSAKGRTCASPSRLSSPAPVPATAAELSFLGRIRAALSLFMRAFK